MRIIEIAKRLRMSKGGIIRWVRLGKIKAIIKKPEWGGHPYYDITEEDLQDYLDNINHSDK